MRSVNYLKVEGHEKLVRDSHSKAIIATDDKEYENYMMRRKIEKQQARVIQRHEETITSMQQDLSDIKNLLIKLIEENNGARNS